MFRKHVLTLCLTLLANAASAQRWDLMILDGAPPGVERLGSLAVGDLDADGKVEIITGGEGAILWYRPATGEKGTIARGQYSVGLVLEDVDGDGRPEVVTGRLLGTEPTQQGSEICWFKPGADLRQAWSSHVIDRRTGRSHDLLFADMDGDGRRELIAGVVGGPTIGLFIYRRPADPRQPWERSTVQEGLSSEGTAAGDVDGDGRPEILSGPYWYKAPAGGPFSGPWKRANLALGFRELCRSALTDITGDGRPDAVVVESEYPDGRLSWFENRSATDPKDPWLEHPMDQPLNFAHSLEVVRDGEKGGARVFVAEMAKGGWSAPFNFDARLLRYDFSAGGKTWSRRLLYQGAGTHQATFHDIDGDGVQEIVGKRWTYPVVHVFKQRSGAAPFARWRHRFLDREKPRTCTDVVAMDVDGDGRRDLLCASWWYRNPDWERFEIPGIHQVLNAHDIDGDGRAELIASRKSAAAKSGLSSDLCWLKPVDARKGQWKQMPIGTGNGDWPHGTVVATLLPDKKLALVAGYHSAQGKGDRPEIFEIPGRPGEAPWPQRVLADIPYGEEMAAADLNGDGLLDLAAGPYWLQNRGDGSFTPHQFVKDLDPARTRVADLNGDGRPDIILAEESLSYQTRESFYGQIAWFENSGAGFEMRVIDRIRCPHSLDVADLDGDGQPEVIAAEHDPFKPYRSRGGLYVYKKADPKARAWYRYTLDHRFEHHVGAKVVELAPGRLGIVSHGWVESKYLHLWEPR